MSRRVIKEEFRCTAKAKRTGKRCMSYRVKGYKVCTKHGAGSPKKGRPGGRPPSVVGRYGKDFPQKLLARYQEGVNDTNLLGLRDEIAVLDVRISDLIKSIETTPPGEAWAGVDAIRGDIINSIRKNDAAKLTDAVTRLTALVDSHRQSDSAWGQLVYLFESRRKLAESERKRIIELEQVITLRELRTLAVAIAGVIEVNITDLDTRRKIIYEIGTLISEGDPIEAGRFLTS